MSYKIVRFRFQDEPQVMATGLTLEQAQAHCNDPETSSSTATGDDALAYTAEYGEPWFDGYNEED